MTRDLAGKRVLVYGGGSGLGLEAAQEGTVTGERRVQELQRDRATEGGVVGEEDLGRRPGAERGTEAIAPAEDAADLVGHARGSHFPLKATGEVRAPWGIMEPCAPSLLTR